MKPETNRAAWKRFIPTEAPGNNTLQLSSCLKAVPCAPGSPISLAVALARVGLGDAAVFESFLIL